MNSEGFGHEGFYLDRFKPMDFGWMDFDLGDFVLIVCLHGSYSLPVVKGDGDLAQTLQMVLKKTDKLTMRKVRSALNQNLQATQTKLMSQKRKKSKASPGGFCTGG